MALAYPEITVSFRGVYSLIHSLPLAVMSTFKETRMRNRQMMRYSSIINFDFIKLRTSYYLLK